ncbi:MAG: hypothetical protein ACR2F0_09265 [Chthoniobacterales bacterium]
MKAHLNQMNKDQIQKLILSAIGLVALVYCYFTFFLGPLNRGRAASEKSIAELQEKLAASKTEMAKAARLEGEAAAATQHFAALKGLIPEGAPIAWFPPRMKVLFANNQIERAAVRLEGTAPFKEPEMADWNRFNWAADLPQTDFVTLGQALAALENTEPLVAISRINISAPGDTPQFQVVTIGLTSALLKQ